MVTHAQNHQRVDNNFGGVLGDEHILRRNFHFIVKLINLSLTDKGGKNALSETSASLPFYAIIKHGKKKRRENAAQVKSHADSQQTPLKICQRGLDGDKSK
jgi:hypothetical protein